MGQLDHQQQCCCSNLSLETSFAFDKVAANTIGVRFPQGDEASAVCLLLLLSTNTGMQDFEAAVAVGP